MAKNILIVPNVGSPNSSPSITFENTTIAGLNVLSGATIAFSANSVSNVLSIQPSNLIISVGDSLNVRNYHSVGGTQVINGTNVWIGPTTGLIGSQGFSGATGGVGSQGAIGGTGNTGAQGGTGTLGAQGDIGGTGNTGAQGGTGTLGAQGAVGGTGNTGAQGGLGPQGPVGPATATGPQGPKGPTGAQGSASATGAQGGLGPQGGTGPQGGPGLQGLTGAQGPKGGQGAQGGLGSTGAPGFTGPTGPPGPGGGQGTQGATGTIGPEGAQGSQGAQGVSGAKGVTCTALSFRIAPFATNTCAALCPGGGTSLTLYSRVITTCTGAVSGNYIFDTLARCISNTTGSQQAGSQRAVCQSYCGVWLTGGICQTPTACSDARLKEAIEVLKDSLENIMKLEVVEFDWNNNLPIPDFYENLVKNKKLHSIGLIAQNVKKYFPEVVGLNHGYYTIHYAKLNAVLVEGIKEQQILIEDIDKEIKFIETKLS